MASIKLLKASYVSCLSGQSQHRKASTREIPYPRSKIMIFGAAWDRFHALQRINTRYQADTSAMPSEAAAEPAKS